MSGPTVATTAAKELAGRPRVLAWAAFLLLVLVVLRPPDTEFKPDPAVYALAGSEMLHGAVPYRDVWDNKGPLLLFTYAGLYALFGNHSVPYDAVLALLLLCAAAGAGLVARQLWGRDAGVWAAAALLFASIFPAARELNAEVLGSLGVVFGVAALLSGLRSGRPLVLLVAGALLALGPMAKPVFCLDLLAVAGALVVWLVGGERAEGGAGPTTGGRLAACAWVLLGAVFGFGLFVAYFAAHGALGDWWDVYIRSNFTYVQHISNDDAVKGAMIFLEGTVFALAALWCLALGGVAGLWSTGKPRHQKLLLCAWLGAACVGILLGRRYYPHYLVQALVPAAVLAGWPLARIAEALRGADRRGRELALAFCLCLAFLVGVQTLSRLYNSAHWWREIRTPDRFVVNELQTADYLRQHTAPGDRLFVVGINGHLSLMTGLRPASRFIYTRFLQQAAGPTRQRVWGIWREDMRRNRPRYVVLSNYDYSLTDDEAGIVRAPELCEWLASEYRYETTIRGPGSASVFYNVLYRRKD